MESFQATIDLNEELVKKLKDQLPYQVADDQENTENKINSYQQEIETSKTQLKDQEEIIQKLQKKLIVWQRKDLEGQVEWKNEANKLGWQRYFRWAESID